MEYRIDYNSAAWFPVPAEFPADGWADEAQWADAVVQAYVDDLGELPDSFEHAIRDFAVTARAARRALADEYLLFCPRSLPLIGVASVHFEPSDPAGALDLDRAVADDDRALLAPTVTDVQSRHLGRGRRAAVIVGSSADGLVAGRFNYAFEHDGCIVAVSAAADRLPDAGFMLPFVDRLVDGIRVAA